VATSARPLPRLSRWPACDPGAASGTTAVTAPVIVGRCTPDGGCRITGGRGLSRGCAGRRVYRLFGL
jgi:hypothetical protein